MGERFRNHEKHERKSLQGVTEEQNVNQKTPSWNADVSSVHPSYSPPTTLILIFLNKKLLALSLSLCCLSLLFSFFITFTPFPDEDKLSKQTSYIFKLCCSQQKKSRWGGKKKLYIMTLSCQFRQTLHIQRERERERERREREREERRERWRGGTILTGTHHHGVTRDTGSP